MKVKALYLAQVLEMAGMAMKTRWPKMRPKICHGPPEVTVEVHENEVVFTIRIKNPWPEHVPKAFDVIA